MKKENFEGLVLLVLGLILAGSGISTPGLFPWQLPACLLGGLMIGRGLVLINN